MSTELERLLRLDNGPFRRLAMRGHIRTYRLTHGGKGGRIISDAGDRPVLLLTTIGRHSGKRRTVPLVYLDDHGTYLVVGANAGRDQDPAWVHNLRAEPSAEVQIGRAHRDVRADFLTADEAAPVWLSLDRHNGLYPGMRAQTDRAFPVIRLVLNPTGTVDNTLGRPRPATH